MLLRNWMRGLFTPWPLAGIAGLPRYIRHWREYARASRDGALRFADSYPCLTDWTSNSPFDAHYFYQGGWLARRIAARRPAEHVDVGSSAPLLSVLSAMTNLTHFDYRPLQADLPGLRCLPGNILDLPLPSGSAGSLSCLHVIEHIGLGRYGDPIDPDGARKAAAELARVLAPGGRLYLSVPVGRERTCFNAHRVFAPAGVPAMLQPLRLEGFALVDDAGRYHDPARPEAAAAQEYGCGLFEFSRPA